MSVKNRLSSDTINHLQEEYLYGSEHDLPFARNLLMDCKLGIRSVDFLSAMGYHTSDWSAMGTIQNQLNKRYDLGIKQLPLGKHMGKLLITQDNYDTYYTYVRKMRKAVSQQGIKEPQKLAEARQKARDEHRQQVKIDKELLKINYSQRRIQRFMSLGLPEEFEIADVTQALGTSRAYASKLTNEMVKCGCVELIFNGAKLGKRNRFNLIVKK